ncbi:DUF1573 domain-containing protein [Tannerella forsythia]
MLRIRTYIIQITKHFIFLLFILILSSCRENNQKKEITEIIKSWQGKEIIFPEGLIFTKYGKDTIEYNIPVSDYKIIMYVDSVGCTECKLLLNRWKKFIHEVNLMTDDTVPILFFFYPKDLREISFILQQDSIDIPVCIDKENKINQINHFPHQQDFQCFLLDKQNRVIYIGNPIRNEQIKKMYLSTISNGKYNPSVQPSGITRIEADKTEFDLGSLKEGDSRKICVTIRNIGKLPLIIHDARTSCGCVQIDYIKRPVASGNTTEINLTYHADKKGPIHKTVSIYGNMDTSPLTINLKGEVKAN